MKESNHSNLISLDEHRPHLIIQTEDNRYHIIPVSLITDIIKGTRKLTDVDDWELIIKRILEEWLEEVKYE